MRRAERAKKTLGLTRRGLCRAGAPNARLWRGGVEDIKGRAGQSPCLVRPAALPAGDSTGPHLKMRPTNPRRGPTNPRMRPYEPKDAAYEPKDAAYEPKDAVLRLGFSCRNTDRTRADAAADGAGRSRAHACSRSTSG